MIYNIDRVLDAMSKILNEFSGLDEYAVQIVQCGECKHLMPSGICEAFADDRIRPSASDYCSYGERREDGVDR